MLLVIDVHAVNEYDSKSALKVLKQLRWKVEHIEKIYADGGYRGELVEKVKHEFGYEMGITLRSTKSVDFKPLPKRWVVERSVALLDDFRRLPKDYERTLIAAVNMIYLAFVALIIKLL